MASPLLRPSLRAPRTISALALTLFAISAPPARAAEPAAPDPYSGTYDVLGHIVLTRKNGHYAAAAELETDFPTHGGAMRADVIGTGNGKPSGKGLAGSAETQLVMQTVPGVDTGFAFIPRQVGPRLVSTWVAHLETDGTLLIELTNQGAKGETYSPTKTTLRGKRVQMPQEPAPKP